MKTSEISLEIFDNDTARWEIFASLEERGAKMRVNLDYVLDRLTEWHERDSRIGVSSGTLHQGIAAPSFHLPLEIGIKFAPQGRGWHPILSDLVPQGFARSYLQARYGVSLDRRADFLALLVGAMNQPGNLRVSPRYESALIQEGLSAAHARQVMTEHMRLRERTKVPAFGGFSKQEIAARSEDFIEYCQQMGTPGTGGTGAQGEAPKYLLREDESGSMFSDGDLSDKDTVRAWIVKFPTFGQPIHRDILQAEASYFSVASRLGLDVYAPSFAQWVEAENGSGALFVPRFDRHFGKRFAAGGQGKTDDPGTHYLGLESLASASLTDQFGTVIPQQEACRLILEFSTEPAKDLVEFLKRDLINILFLNSDNHGRNTAFIKRPVGSIRLAPVYDFAPMALDPRGIARLARFPSEHGSAFGLPNYFEEIERAFKWPQSTLRFANTHVLTHAKEQIAEELRGFMTSLAGLDIADLLDACLPRPPEGIAEKIIGSFERRRAYFREV